jgi:hypothetical protein
MIDFDQQGKVFDDFKAQVPTELFERLVVETSQSGGRHIIVRTESPIGKSQKSLSMPMVKSSSKHEPKDRCFSARPRRATNSFKVLSNISLSCKTMT